MDAKQFQKLLKGMIGAVYNALAEQGSVTPALRYRVEGYAMAGLTIGLVDAGVLAGMLEQAHLEALQETFESRQGVAAINCIDPSAGTLDLPVRMARAPVWPSTTEDS